MEYNVRKCPDIYKNSTLVRKVIFSEMIVKY